MKHLISATKVKPSAFSQSVYGTAQIYTWRASNVKNGRKILQYMLEGLGGRQLKCFELQSQAATKNTASKFEDKTDEEIDAGFDFIAHEGPRSTSDMAQLRWMTKSIKNSSSPIYNWPTVLVEKALRNLATDGALAKKEFSWPLPLTSTYFHPWLLELLETVWDFDMSALIMLGEAGSGKSPLGRSVMMAQARHNQVRFGSRLKPCIRCSPEIDFLRGEQGFITMGDFLDDTCMRVLSSKVLKSLLDVGRYEAMSWARWGAVKWVQNQPRAVADNTFDDEVVLTEPDFVTSVSFDDFMKIIRPAFHPHISKSHMQAVLKRSCIIVNTATHVYYHMAGINEKPVPRIHIEAAEFLTDAGKKLYGAFKNGSRILPEYFDAQVRREEAWVGELVDKRVAERRPDHHLRVGVRRGLFGDASASSRRAPIFRQVDRDAVRVKRERAEEVEQVFKKAGTWAAELRASSSVIDLNSPDRKVNENPSTLGSSTGAGDAVHVANPSSLDPHAASDAVHPETPRPTVPNSDFPELGEFMDSVVDEGMDCDDEDPLRHGYDLVSHE